MGHRRRHGHRGLARSRGAADRARLHAAPDRRRPEDDRRGSGRRHHRPRYGPCVRRRAGGQRAARRPGAPRGRTSGGHPDRHQGRYGATAGGVGAGRTSEGDPEGLRGESRGSRRPSDRPLSPPCARPTDAVAHVGQGARAPRGRGARIARRSRERHPRPARRGIRARPRERSPGRAQPPRRSCAPRRCRRAVRRARSHPDRPLAARRASPCGGSRPATRARRGRGGAFGDAGRGGARMGARPRPERRH